MSSESQIRKLFPPRNIVRTAVKTLEAEELDWGTRSLIEYAVSPREHIKAYLLIPRALRGKAPGVIASHQHNGEWHLGKSEPAGIRGMPSCYYGVDLCKLGCVVLCPDHLGFEDRQAAPVSENHGKTLRNREFEEFVFVDQLLHGSSLAAKYTHDLCQGLDLLGSLKEVDPTRLGVLGHSLGGQTAMWLAVFDRRVKVAFSSCGFSTLAAVQAHHLLHNLAAYVPGLLRIGDIDDVAAAIAPRAFGMSHGKRDPIFPMDGVRKITARIRRIFPKDKLLAIQFDGPHEFNDAVKQRAYDFLLRHLGK